MPGFDPVRYKVLYATSGLVADGWKRTGYVGARRSVVNDRLVELSGIWPGHRVLDIATGLGGKPFTVRAEWDGGLVWDDLSPALLALGS